MVRSVIVFIILIIFTSCNDNAKVLQKNKSNQYYHICLVNKHDKLRIDIDNKSGNIKSFLYTNNKLIDSTNLDIKGIVFIKNWNDTSIEVVNYISEDIFKHKSNSLKNTRISQYNIKMTEQIYKGSIITNFYEIDSLFYDCTADLMCFYFKERLVLKDNPVNIIFKDDEILVRHISNGFFNFQQLNFYNPQLKSQIESFINLNID